MYAWVLGGLTMWDEELCWEGWNVWWVVVHHRHFPPLQAPANIVKLLTFLCVTSFHTSDLFYPSSLPACTVFSLCSPCCLVYSLFGPLPPHIDAVGSRPSAWGVSSCLVILSYCWPPTPHVATVGASAYAECISSLLKVERMADVRKCVCMSVG